MAHQVKKIISGGQTGADQGALDAAIRLGIEHGGFCPRGRKSEDGRIPLRYKLQEHESFEYRDRTKANVEIADGTLVFFYGHESPGSVLTWNLANQRGPALPIKLRERRGWIFNAQLVRGWLVRWEIQTLNVAGTRESRAPGIQEAVAAFLVMVLQ